MLVLLATTVTVARTPSLLTRTDASEREAWVEQTLATLSAEQRVAQLMVVAINPNHSTAMRARIKEVVERGVGGLIYNESNIAAHVDATNYAQSLASVPLMITVDGEWGLAMRLTDAPSFPHNLMMGSVDDDKLYYRYGRELARQCQALGIHVNFAPVLDVLDRKGSTMGDRSFGYDPDMVANHGIAFAKGMEDGGVLSVGKHFPGHGATFDDSHKMLPTINKPLKELQFVDIYPFKKFVGAGLGGMMVAHLYVPAIDKEYGPATLSQPVVSGLLKNELGFEGLIFTDALQMEGAKAGSGSQCVAALRAGNDVLLMPGNIDKEIAAVTRAIADGELSQAVVDNACRKILRYKYALGLSTKPRAIDAAEARKVVNGPEAKVLARQLVEASITVVHNADNLLPLRHLDKRRIAIVPLGSVPLDKLVARCRSYADVKVLRPDEIDRAGHDVLIVATADAATAEQAQRLLAGAKCGIIAVLASPADVDAYADALVAPGAKAALWAPERGNAHQDCMAQVLFGGCDAAGALPVDLKSARYRKSYLAGSGVKYKACRLGYSIPEAVGFDSRLQQRVDSVCNYGIREHAFPGCQVLVARHGKVVVNSCYGTIDFNSKTAVTEHTLYDLASVSKATGTISAVMKTFDNGKFRLDEPASRYIPGLRGGDKEDITFRQLLFHETGMKPSLNMWNLMMDKSTYSGTLITNKPTAVNTIKVMNNAYGHKDARLRADLVSTTPSERFNIAIAEGLYAGKHTYDTVMNWIYTSPLNATKKYVYSCLNFSLLADAMQRINRRWLNEIVDEQIFAPLGAYHTLYRPLSRFEPEQIAYTEVDTYLRRQHLHGYVHDELNAFSLGVQGNAGLFSNANDLAKLFQMWLNGGTYGGNRFLKKSTVDVFLTQKSPNSHRGLGFDKPVIGDPDASNTCPEATPSVIGHTGFTGTGYWIDPENDMIYIFLSNRVCPTRDNPAFSRVSARSHLNTIVYQSIVK